MNRKFKLKFINLCIGLIYLILLSKFIYWVGHYIFNYDLKLFEVINFPYANTLITVTLVGLVIFLEIYGEAIESKK
ncbi:hypothetical protein BFS35_000110 [Macrococcoides goetzii]|uniref:Uncharacterized protein n=1 Tax=Macrococcoides goetzii TaxID=1891097 RepID=A0A2G5NNS2_9STAP|nr:hypothetical protein [Macrococcus goetzii]RAI82122.1 hypothetical protein BFS35_000110 [Macrococcus goetzii]